MLNLKKTTSEHPDFIDLVAALDQDLARRDGEEHAFYDQFNSIEGLRHVIVAYSDKVPIGCGAIKDFDSRSMEVKRMYVKPEYRGKGIASRLLIELENWAESLGYSSCILETGKRQPEAISLYTKNGYTPIPNYEPYQGVENSVCFQKQF